MVMELVIPLIAHWDHKGVKKWLHNLCGYITVIYFPFHA